MENKKKYHGNIDISHLMNEQELAYYWFKLIRVIPDLNPVKPPIKHVHVQCFSAAEIKEFERNDQRFGTSWLTAANFHEKELLHDPTVMGNIDELLIDKP